VSANPPKFRFHEAMPPGAVAQLFGPEWQTSWRNVLGQELQPMISTIQGAPAQLNPIFMGMWLGSRQPVVGAKIQ